MKNAGKVLCVACAAVTAFMLFSCQKKAVQGKTTAGTKTPVTFTYYDIEGNGDKPWTDAVAKRITELTGVTLDYQYPVGGSEMEQIPLMIASGDFPDLIYCSFDIPSMIDSGSVIPLDDFIEAKGNNIKKHYGEYLARLKNSAEDPHIYQLGKEEIVKARWNPDDAPILVQHAVLKEAGYPKVETLSDLEALLKNYKAKYPAIDGKPTLGMTMVMPFWWLLHIGNPSNFMMGVPDNGEWMTNEKTLETVYKWSYPGMEQYARWLSRMNAEGVLDPEIFTQTYDDYLAKIASGRVLAVPYPSTWNAQGVQTLLADGKIERTYAPLPVVLEKGIKNPALKDPGFPGGWGLSITKGCKDPERAFEFLDWLCSDEAQILLNWGIEGVNYTVENGKRIMSDAEFRRYTEDQDYAKNTGVNWWVGQFPKRGSGAVDSQGNYFTPKNPDIIKRNYNASEKETLAAYGVDMWTDLFPSSEELGIGNSWGQAAWITLTPEVHLFYEEAHEITERAMGKAVFSPPSEFDNVWSAYQAELKAAGMDEANKRMTELVKNRVKLWEE